MLTSLAIQVTLEPILKLFLNIGFWKFRILVEISGLRPRLRNGYQDKTYKMIVKYMSSYLDLLLTYIFCPLLFVLFRIIFQLSHCFSKFLGVNDVIELS